LLTAGRHPLYQKGDSIVTYKQKLESPKWKFPENIAFLAKDLFLRMIKTQAQERYTASEALQHP